ncbi:MAG: hypothetical protein WBS22_18985 [Methylocystis sp.]
MDRRAFITKTLLAAGVFAATSSAALALPMAPARDAVVPEGPVENVWWRRWHWRRWHWRRWRRW